MATVADLQHAYEVLQQRRHDHQRDGEPIEVTVERYWDVFTNPATQQQVAEIVKHGRKHAVHLRIVLDHQHMSLADFGNCLGLREQICINYLRDGAR